RRFGTMTNGKFNPLDALGGSLLQSKVIAGCEGETIPPEANIVTKRVTTPLFGIGLVDAVPDTTFLWVALLQKFIWPDTAGRPNFVADITGQIRVGRFGWKSQVPSVKEFAGEAYLNEMGITSPMFPEENCPGGDCSKLSCDTVPDPEDDGQTLLALTDF